MSQIPHGESEAAHAVVGGLRWALVLTLLTLAVESIGAILSRSLSLTVDAFHNIPDVLAFALSWISLELAGRGATRSHTFGLHRTETMAALANAALVAGTGLVFAYEAIHTLTSGGSFRGTVDPLWVIAAAVPTMVLRSVAASLLSRIPQTIRDLNLRSVLLHLASDVAISGVILADGFILLLRPSASWVDPVASLVVSAFLVGESLPLFRQAWATLTEAVPPGLSVEAIQRVACQVPHVEDLHDVHVWSVCSSLICLTAHVRTDRDSLREGAEVVSALKARMASEFGIVHSVFEVEGR